MNFQIRQLLDRNVDCLDKVHTARVREESFADELFQHFAVICGIDQMMSQLEGVAIGFFAGLFPNVNFQISGKPRITFNLSGCKFTGQTTYARETTGVSRNVFSKVN